MNAYSPRPDSRRFTSPASTFTRPPLSSPNRDQVTTALPITKNSSIFLHNAFYDLLGLGLAAVNGTTPASSPSLAGYDRNGGYFAAATSPQARQRDQFESFAGSPAPYSPSAGAGNRPKREAGKRISVDMIGNPTGFA